MVVEGWYDLKIEDPVIDELLKSESVKFLKNFRSTRFHYQKKYFEKKIIKFIETGKANFASCSTGNFPILHTCKVRIMYIM